MFPTSGFDPGNARRRQEPKTRYVCANGGNGCGEYVDLRLSSIARQRIPRCKCSDKMVPRKPTGKK